MDNTVRVLSTLALKGALVRLAAAYQAASGVRIDADFAPTLALLERLAGGEVADLVILTREGLDAMIGEGRIARASAIDLARSYVGVAVKAGAPHPDIATEAALRTALLGARAVIIPMGFTAEKLVSGEAELAIQQISELKQVDGVEVVGPIPLDLQTPAVFSAGRMAATRCAEAAEHLLHYLSAPEVAPVLRETGLEP